MRLFDYVVLLLLFFCPYWGILVSFLSNTSIKTQNPGGGGHSDQYFLGMCHWHLRTPTPLLSIYFDANYRPHLKHFWANDFFNLKVPKKWDPILVTIENAWKRNPIIVCQSSRENATPSSGTSPVLSSPLLGSAPPPLPPPLRLEKLV